MHPLLVKLGRLRVARARAGRWGAAERPCMGGIIVAAFRIVAALRWLRHVRRNPLDHRCVQVAVEAR